ncbi:hypothetical protein GCM10027280_04850 [Micromonospora polyrhachis]
MPPLAVGVGNNRVATPAKLGRRVAPGDGDMFDPYATAVSMGRRPWRVPVGSTRSGKPY